MADERKYLRAGVRGGVTAALCVLMVVPPATMAQGVASESMQPIGTAKSALPHEVHAKPLTQQERVLHVLNRFTFGPRPGEVEAVEREGLSHWFDQQLHPQSIDDSAFEAKLARDPAMQLTTAELQERFPGPAELRRAARVGDRMTSSDPVDRAIWADAAANFEARRKQQEQAATQGATSGNTMPATGDLMQAAQENPTQTDETGLRARQRRINAGFAALSAADNDSATAADSGKAAPQDMAATTKASARRADRRAEALPTSDVNAVLSLPAEERFGRLVAMQPNQMIAFRDGLRPVDRSALMEGLTPAQTEAVVAMLQQPDRVVIGETLATRLLRDIDSQRQLQAVMTDFWLNHFSVYLRKNQDEPYYLPEYQRDVVLPRALGSFEDLLVATAKSPAMLLYLDNWESIGPDSIAAQRVKMIQERRPNAKGAQALPKGINENYARELMELHTLGVNGGYTQQDVIEVAKCFTGWTIDRKPNGEGTGEFVFDPNRHEGGTKIVLGHKIKEGGMNEGLEVLHILATSPATARFISTKLAVRFVSDTPPPSLVNKMATTFERTNGNIPAVLKTMFDAPEFWSPGVYRAKVKTPIEFLVSALRASDAQVTNPVVLEPVMQRLGMPVYGMQTPNGYAWTQDAWVSSNELVTRMNLALVLSSNRQPGVRIDWPQLLGASDANQALTNDPDAQTERRLETLLLGQPASERTRETVLAQFKDPTAQQQAEQSLRAQPVAQSQAGAAGAAMLERANFGRRAQQAGSSARPGPATPLDTMAGLLLGSPEFQRR